MKAIQRYLCMALVALFTHLPSMAQGRLVINELMQSNMDFMMVDHDFPDSWVELYNGSSKSIFIAQSRIGTSNVFSEAFRLSKTSLTIEPGEHLVLYCDKTTGTPFHYNFSASTMVRRPM